MDPDEASAAEEAAAMEAGIALPPENSSPTNLTTPEDCSPTLAVVFDAEQGCQVISVHPASPDEPPFSPKDIETITEKMGPEAEKVISWSSFCPSRKCLFELTLLPSTASAPTKNVTSLPFCVLD